MRDVSNSTEALFFHMSDQGFIEVTEVCFQFSVGGSHGRFVDEDPNV
jgi:hypothetical protein